MANYKKFVLFVCALLIQQIVTAQTANASGADMGLMRSEGKIYVVMAVVITILAGVIIYIARLDRKITKLEKGSDF